MFCKLLILGIKDLPVMKIVMTRGRTRKIMKNRWRGQDQKSIRKKIVTKKRIGIGKMTEILGKRIIAIEIESATTPEIGRGAIAMKEEGIEVIKIEIGIEMIEIGVIEIETIETEETEIGVREATEEEIEEGIETETEDKEDKEYKKILTLNKGDRSKESGRQIQKKLKKCKKSLIKK